MNKATQGKIKESVQVLQECMELQIKKGQDYQNPNSNVRQAMHYRRGIDSLHDIMQGKLYRAQSLLESMQEPDAKINFESLEDTYKDLINYASFAVEYLRGAMDGQDSSRDIFNRPRPHDEFRDKLTGVVELTDRPYVQGMITPKPQPGH